VAWSYESWEGYPADVYDSPRQNREYGKVTARNDPRSFRAALKISF
jgi:hypothetical protein